MWPDEWMKSWMRGQRLASCNNVEGRSKTECHQVPAWKYRLASQGS